MGGWEHQSPIVLASLANLLFIDRAVRISHLKRLFGDLNMWINSQKSILFRIFVFRSLNLRPFLFLKGQPNPF